MQMFDRQSNKHIAIYISNINANSGLNFPNIKLWKSTKTKHKNIDKFILFNFSLSEWVFQAKKIRLSILQQYNNILTSKLYLTSMIFPHIQD